MPDTALELKYPSLGCGRNTFSNSDADKVLVPKIAELAPSAEAKVYYCKTSEEIAEKLESSGSIAASYSGATFTAKAEYAHELTPATNALTVLVVAKQSFQAQVQDATFTRDFSTSKQLLE